MRSPSRPPALLAAAAAWLLAVPVRGADFLPAVSLHLEAARYAPVETDLHWTGTMGGGADIVEVGSLRAYIVGDVETIIGGTRRAFDATQANYRLETGVRRRVKGVTVNPFFHHVSRHLSDREKAPAVDWNILGVRVAADVGRDRRARVGGSIGHTTLASLVGYRWELTARGDVDVVRRERFAAYAAARARLVTIDPDPALPRDDFLDFAIEGGLRFPRQARVFEAFAAFERRHDVFLLTPGARDRGLFGVRIRLIVD
jgi:opacity protein-like surface antigen